MILQWVKLHDTASVKIRYGAVVKYGSLINPSYLRGNVLNWKRDNLWKCVEYINDKVVEHIVHFTSPDEPMIVLLSKFSTSMDSCYTQMYRNGIRKWFDREQSDMKSKFTVPHLLFNVVKLLSRVDTLSYLPNILDEWEQKNDHIYNSVPILSTMYLDQKTWTMQDSELSGVQSDIDSVGLLPVADSVHNLLTETLEEIQYGDLESDNLDKCLDTSFTPFKYFTFGKLTYRPNFAHSDVSASFLESRSDRSIVSETLVAPMVSDIAGVDKDAIRIPEHSKEITSIVTSIQSSTSITDFKLLFDMNRFYNSSYEPISVEVYDRYTGSVVPVMPYISRYNEAYRIGDNDYRDWTLVVGEAICDYVCTLLNNVDVHNRYELVQVIKTYNEDLIIQFGTRDQKWLETHYVDILGCLMTTTDMGTIGSVL